MLLAGKKGLVLNVTNHHSIGWSVAKAAHDHGATVGVGVQSERIREKVEAMIADYPRMELIMVDFADDELMAGLAQTVVDRYGKIDFLVHSAAYANREDLAGRFIDTSRAGFSLALDISAFSLVALCKLLEPHFNEDASVMAMSFLGSSRAAKNYNVMGVAKAALEASVRYLTVDLGVKGIRVNTLSPGPLNTVAARGVKDLNALIAHVQDGAPLKRPFGQAEVAGNAVFLISDLSKGVTGQVIFIDSGYSIAAL